MDLRFRSFVYSDIKVCNVPFLSRMLATGRNFLMILVDLLCD